MSTFDDELTLITFEDSVNDIGDVVKDEENKRKILCDVKSVNRSEFYAAARSDMKPEAVFEVNKYDYSNEKIVEHDGQRYDVIRSYMPRGRQDLDNFEILELVCEGVNHNGSSES